MEFEKIVSAISSRFVGFLDVDDAINTSLGDIARFCGASRAYLFLFNEYGATTDNTHEWCAEGVSAQIDNLKNLPSDMFPWWMSKLRKGETIHIKDVSKLPPEAKAEKEILRAQDVQSLLVLPVFMEGKLAGFIGFDNIMNTGEWSDEDLAILRISSETISNTLERKRAEATLRESEERYRELVNSSVDGMISIDPDMKIILWNPGAERLFGYTQKEMHGQSLMKIIPERYRKAKEKGFIEFRKSGSGPAIGKTLELEGLRKDGKEIQIELSVSSRKVAEKHIATAIVRDITERKQKEAIHIVLFNISKATTKTSNLYDLLATIHEQVGTLMDAENFFVCLACDAEKNLYTYPYYKDINPEDLVEPDEIIEITEGLTHHVLKTKEYLLGNKEELKKIGVIGTVPESWLGVPLKTESDDVNGVIAVQSYEKEAYSEEDAQVLSIIASNVGGFLKYKKAEEQLRSALKEKEVLLKEIHHRVKNNLQLISSLLNLQSSYISGKKNIEIFKESQNRVRSMALIHEQLYQSPDLAKVNFKEYIQTLANSLFRSYMSSLDKIAIKIDIEDVSLGVDNAIPCGLIINELVSNSLKHAFPDKREGEIKICLRSVNKKDIELVVSDDGIGIPEDLDIRKTKSLGLHLVTILAEDQIYGEIKLNRKKGTEFRIKLKGVK